MTGPSEPSHREAVAHFRALLKGKNEAGMRKLCQAFHIEQSDVHREFRRSPTDVEELRILYRLGGDPDWFQLKDLKDLESDAKRLEILEVLDEQGYDFKNLGHLALEYFADSKTVLDWLLDHGANINKTDTSRTDRGIRLDASGTETDPSNHLLNRIAATGDMELFDHLVFRGADPKNSFALHCATECKDHDLSVRTIGYLLDKYQLDINADMEDLRKLFRFLPDTGSPLNNAVYFQNLPAVKYLLSRGADPGIGRVPAYRQAVGDKCFYRDGYLPGLKPLLDAGADATAALEAAACNEKFESVLKILKYDPDIDRILEWDKEKVNALAEAECIDSEDTSPEKRPMSHDMRRLLVSALGEKIP